MTPRPVSAIAVGDREQLVARRVAVPMFAPSLGAVHVGAGGGEADRAGLEPARRARPSRQLVVGRRLVRVGAALAHHVGAQRGVRRCARRGRAVTVGARARRGTRGTSPSPTSAPRRARCRGCPRRPRAGRSASRGVGGRLGRGEADAAVAHGDRGDAVDATRRQIGSQVAWPSKWVWMSTKPGVTRSRRRRLPGARPSTSPTAVMVPP